METAIKNLSNSAGNKKRGKFIIIAALLFFLVPTLAMAVPNLQIYIPDATYDYETETWIINSYKYQLWVTGANVKVSDVRFAAAFPTGEKGSVKVTWLDPSIPDYGSANSYNQEFYDENGNFTLTFSDSDKDPYLRVGTQLDYDEYLATIPVPYDADSNLQDPNPTTYGLAKNDTPVFGDGKDIPDHGVFPTDFYEYYIGDFTPITGDEPNVPNYDPAEYDPDLGWVNTAFGMTKKFYIEVEGYEWVDIVAYDHYLGNKVKYIKTPFSHDGASTPAPEPATMLLLGSGLIGLGWFGRRRTKKGSKV